MTSISLTSEVAVSSYTESDQFKDGKFRNPITAPAKGWADSASIMWQFFFNKPDDAVPSDPLPVKEISQQDLLKATDNSFYRLGHSSLLFKLNGGFWLTDPVFAERASPVQWASPKRFHKTPINIEQLPQIRGVIISHDHYDHLDRAAVLQLAEKVDTFYTPLGVGQLLINWGISPDKIQQLDWWQSASDSEVKLTATPAQHFPGRGLNDGNTRLWASWVIESQDTKIFFSGDSGYFDGFKQIGDRLGPFDITFVETGAYDKNWLDVHMMPEQSLQAHLDLRGKIMMPIHNGTFDLALHPWYDPFEKITDLAQKKGVELTTPMMGERNDIHSPQPVSYWWRKLMHKRAKSKIVTIKSA